MIKNNYVILILIVIILILLLVILFLIFNKTIYKESFANPSNISLNIQNGYGPITPTGSITFPNPFTTAPLILTQIVGSSSSANNAYSIQVFNVTNTGFDYSKNRIENAQSGQFTVTKLGTSTVEPFYWIAMGQ
jgi:hypothetical protein